LGLDLPSCSSKPLYFVERGEQRPRFQRAAIGGSGHQPQHAAAAALVGLKSEERFDRVSAGARHMAGRGALRIRPETNRMGSPGMRFQLAEYSFPAVDRPDVPGQGQHVAPMALGMKERLEQDVVASRKSFLERREPMVRDRREGFRYGKRGLGCHGLTRLAFIRSVTSMWPGACVMHSEGRASSTTDCGVMPQAQKKRQLVLAHFRGIARPRAREVLDADQIGPAEVHRRAVHPWIAEVISIARIASAG